MTNKNTTIVSAFISNINKRDDRTYDKYIHLASYLLKTKIHKIIFIDENVINQFTQFCNEYTFLIPFNKKDNYLYKYKNTLNQNINTTNPNKDTIEYIFTMCYKTEFIKQSIELNPFNTKQFIWCDLAIKHMINYSDTEFIQKIENLNNISYNNLRISSIWNPDIDYWIDIYKDISWYYAGSIFGGDVNSLIQFANLTKQKCLQIIKEHNSLMWEVNVWLIIYRENKQLFNNYNCLHDNSILDNY